METKQEKGKIKFILGPMFSGKSTRLIEIIRKSVYQAKKSIMVKLFPTKDIQKNQKSSHMI